MLYGYPLSGKSTAAEKIRQRISNSEIISSARIRLRGKRHSSTAAFVDEDNPRTRRVKDWAYKRLCSRAKQLLLKGKVPILDATFHRHYRRKWVYGIARKLKAEVYIVWVSFGKSVASLLKRRAPEKRALHTPGQYLTMVRQTESLEDYELKKRDGPKIIKFDRASHKIRSYSCGNDGFARKVAACVSKKPGGY